MEQASGNCDESKTALNAKLALLSKPEAYPQPVDMVEVRETHMSWIFLAGDCVYKLKKPLLSDFLDFSNLKRREAACRAEFRLNRRLAPRTYLDVVPLTQTDGRMSIGGDGQPVDWLVVMRRLDERLMLDELLRQRQTPLRDIDRLAATLARFYRHAKPSCLAPRAHIAEWQSGLQYNRRMLLKPELKLPGGLIRRIDNTQRACLALSEPTITQRSRERFIVEAHGDLRPEHIWMGEPLQIIDCLEFNQRLRTLDILSEIAFLDLECSRLGAPWVGARLCKGIFARLPRLKDASLFRFYRSCHAMVRARLAIAHLLEPQPREPRKWRPLALQYLQLADRDVRQLPGFVKTP